MTLSLNDYFDAYFSGNPFHPEFIRLSAAIITLRSMRLPDAKKELRNLAQEYRSYADHLETQLPAELRDARSQLGLDIERPAYWHPIELCGYSGKVKTWVDPPAGIQAFSLTLYDAACPPGEYIDEHMVAMIAALEHVPGYWEVADMEVREDHRGQQLSTAMYDTLRRYTRAPSECPSGWLTEDGLAFWKKRNPEAVRRHFPHPGIDGVFVSSKQTYVLEAVDQWRRLVEWKAECENPPN